MYFVNLQKKHGYLLSEQAVLSHDKLILASKERFVLADASKLGHATLSSFAKLSEVNLLITAGNVPEDFKGGLEELGQRFRIADST